MFCYRWRKTDIIYYKLLDLPPIPEHLIDCEKIKNLTVVQDIGYGKVHEKSGIKLTACKYSYADADDQKLLKWVRENICNKLIKVLYQSQINVSNSYSTHIVHSDIKRIRALNYIIETGGPNTLLNWYKEKNQPIRRGKVSGGSQSDTGYVSYDDLELLESVHLEKHTWSLIATNVLHEVDFIESERISLSISFEDIYDTKLIKNL